MSYKYEHRQRPFFVSNRFRSLSPIPHFHTHLELIYLFEGTGTATVDCVAYPLSPGDIFLSFPNQVHYFDVSPARGYVFIVSPDLIPDLRSIMLSKTPQTPIIARSDLPDRIADRLVDIFRCANNQSPLSLVAANGYMQALLAELLQIIPLSDTDVKPDSVRQVLLYCSEHYTQPLSLEILSRELHLSADYISHIFSDRLGTYFSDMINRLRVERACQLLREGCSATEAAYAAGFGSIRSFNRNFKQFAGVAPSKYLAQSKESSVQPT